MKQVQKQSTLVLYRHSHDAFLSIAVMHICMRKVFSQHANKYGTVNALLYCPGL